MPIRIYIAPQIGDGTKTVERSLWTDSIGAFRSLLHKYVDVASGENFDEIDHPARRISMCTVEASSATLDAIEADARVTAVIPIRAMDRTHLVQILNAPFSAYPLAWRNAAKAKLESWGFNTEWITGSHTMKDVLRQVIKIMSACQIADGMGQDNVKTFLTNNLDTTVALIPAAQRNAIGSWMQAKGIDISWITGTTTVREVVHVLANNFARLYGRDVPHRFSGEDF